MGSATLASPMARMRRPVGDRRWRRRRVGGGARDLDDVRAEVGSEAGVVTANQGIVELNQGVGRMEVGRLSRIGSATRATNPRGPNHRVSASKTP